MSIDEMLETQLSLERRLKAIRAVLSFPCSPDVRRQAEILQADILRHQRLVHEEFIRDEYNSGLDSVE